jgi:hypothetical protein
MFMPAGVKNACTALIKEKMSKDSLSLTILPKLIKLFCKWF